MHFLVWEQRKFESLIYPEKIKNKNNLQLPAYSISNKNGFIAQTAQFGKDNTYSKTDKKTNYIVNPGAFAYNPARINVGSIGYQNLATPVLVNSLYEVFKTNSQINDLFLIYWFKTDKFFNQIKKYEEGGVRQYYFLDKLLFSEIIIPKDAREQQKISKILKKLDYLISLQQRKLEQLKMIQKIIAYNLVASHSLKKTNTVAWKTKYLKNIAKIYQPTTITQNDLLDIGIPVFGANNYIGFYSKANHDTDQVTICARGANTGNPSYVKGPVWITGNSMVINVNENSVNKRFLYTLLTFTDLKRFVTGGAQPQITRESLNSLKLALPSIKTQNDLSVILGKLNIEVQNIQFYNNSLKKLEQSLLRNMFI